MRIWTDLVSQASYLIQDLERMAKAKNYLAWQARLVGREIGQRVVEVGCGLGNFTSALLDREAVIAVDIDSYCIERVRQRYPQYTNLHTFVRDITDSNDEAFSEIAGFQPDSCVCLNALEHIEDDFSALLRMKSILIPGGAIVLLVPAFEALYGPTDKNLGHYRRYSRTSIRKLAAVTGLHIRKIHYINLIGLFGWCANSHIFHREAQSEAQIAIFDRFVVPVMSRLEAILPPPFGQSLFVVLERP